MASAWSVRGESRVSAMSNVGAIAARVWNLAAVSVSLPIHFIVVEIRDVWSNGSLAVVFVVSPSSGIARNTVPFCT